MAYSGDRLYNEVIRKKLGELSTKIRVRDIVPHLSCLTLSDREEIEAKRDHSGNYTAVSLLIENLHRRENWAEQFIAALRACEHTALANEISEAYDRIRGKKAASTPALPPPPPPPAASVSLVAPPAPAASPEKASTVTTATVHTVPHSTPHLLTPLTETSAYRNPVNSSPGPFSNVTTLTNPEAPALVSAPDAPVQSSSESAHPSEPPLSVLAADARAHAPVSPPKLIASFGQNEVPAKPDTSGVSVPLNSSSESCSNVDSPAFSVASALASVVNASVQPPREPANSAEVPLLVSTPHAMPPSPVSAPKVTPCSYQIEVPVSSVETAKQGASGVLTTTSLSGPSSVVAPTLPNNPTPTLSQANKPATTSQSSASPEKSNIPVENRESSSSVKRPIQDSNPPATELTQDLQNNSNQVVKRGSAVPPNDQNRTTQPLPSASPDSIAVSLPDSGAANEEYYSKPGILRTQEPFSGISYDLEISNVDIRCSPIQQTWPGVEARRYESVSVTTNELMISTSTTALSHCVSDPKTNVQNSTPGALDVGNSHPNYPVEDHYESTCQSLQRESETREFILKLSEEASVQNLCGQPTSMAGPTTMGLSNSCETESPAQSVSEVPLSQHSESISQCIQGNNAREQTYPAPGFTTYGEPGQDAFQESELNASGQINFPPSEQNEESQGLLRQVQSHPYFIVAAAIGMTAVFVALKYK